jgi:hydroxymethylpyrimidine pyrophosphatase-like HAD family hydrolase
MCCAAGARYYEPLAAELADVEQLLAGPAVRKLLFMTAPDLVEALVKPHWAQALQGQAAEVMQAVPNMLEVVPAGVNKWAGLQVRCRVDARGSLAVCSS